MAQIVKNTVYYAIGNFVTKAVSFLLLPLYLKYLSPVDYGIVNSMQVFSGIIGIFLTFGLERSIYRLFFDYKTDSEKRAFLGTVSLSIFFLSILICLLMFLFSGTISSIYKSIPFNPYYIYAIITAFFTTFELVPFIAFQVKLKARSYLFYSLTLLVFKILPVIWFVVFMEEGAVGMLKGATVGGGLGLIILLPLTLKEITLSLKLDILKNTLAYCLPLVPLVISAWVVNMSDRIFIERYFGTYEVGIYSLGYKIGQLVQFAAVAVLMAYNPFFYKLANSEDSLQARKKIFQANNIIVLFMLLIVFSVALLSKDIIFLFFDKEYQDTYIIIPIIALGSFFVQMISLQNLSFYQAKKTLIIMYINITAACVNILLNFLLIKEYGYLGAAWATLVTQIIFFLIVYQFAKRYFFTPYNWKEIVPLVTTFCILVLVNLYFIETGWIALTSKSLLLVIIVITLGLYKKRTLATLR